MDDIKYIQSLKPREVNLDQPHDVFKANQKYNGELYKCKTRVAHEMTEFHLGAKHRIHTAMEIVNDFKIAYQNDLLT